MVNVANIEDGTVIKSSTLRKLDDATQKYDVWGTKYLKLQIPGDNKMISLSEVVISGATAVAVTAFNPSFDQTWMYPNMIINGVINGNWAAGDVTSSALSSNPWVLIELAGVVDDNEVRATIYGRTDCCHDRMNGMVASLQYGLTDGLVIKSSTLRLVNSATQKYDVFSKKYLKLQIPGDNKMISLSEVVISGATAVAVTAFNPSFDQTWMYPNMIINGVINGNWAAGDVTHSAFSSNPWVLIELAGVVDANQVKATIYGRTDCCQDRINGLIASVQHGKCS
jgi:hypothetical protein